MSFILPGIAGVLLCFSTYCLLKAWLKFGEPYSSLREKMEDVREQLRTEVESGKYSREELSGVVTKFNETARFLRILGESRRGRNESRS